MWSTYGFMLYILLCIFSKYGQGYRRPDAREFYDPRKPSNWNPKRMRSRVQSRAKPSNLYSLVPAGDGQYFKRKKTIAFFTNIVKHYRMTT
ncbi:unnamed protein product [Plutella xylostella]|uniref:(diamondback moth) hypothetical protein n=1 Tax=Plutella xylostella TaxID=51655 RepID=A0A8S4FYB4_PLUXY|nr:unnamed protein product [Plutella xylostella]